MCEFTICQPLGQQSISFRLELFPSRQCQKITPREHTIARNVLLRTLHPSKTDQSSDSLPSPSFTFHCSTRSEVCKCKCNRLSKVDRYIWYSWCLSKVELYSVEVRTLDWTRGLDSWTGLRTRRCRLRFGQMRRSALTISYWKSLLRLST